MGRKYRILPTKTRFGFAKAEVEVHKCLDRSICIFYKGEELPDRPIIPVEGKRYASPQMRALPVEI